MKRKVLYTLATAIIAVTAFFIGKNFTEPTRQPEIIATEEQEITALTVTEYGLQIDFTDGTGIWLDTESLENAGLIDTANIVDWNTAEQSLPS